MFTCSLRYVLFHMMVCPVVENGFKVLTVSNRWEHILVSLTTHWF
jgi:hypothetical protein